MSTPQVSNALQYGMKCVKLKNEISTKCIFTTNHQLWQICNHVVKIQHINKSIKFTTVTKRQTLSFFLKFKILDVKILASITAYITLHGTQQILHQCNNMLRKYESVSQ